MKVLRLFVLFWVMALTHYAKATNAHVEGLVYKINEKAKTAIVIACEKTGYVTIPESISFLGDEYVVKAIGDEAFAHNRQIEGVTIPGTIETIKNSAFSFCKELKVVDIKYGVKKNNLGEIKMSIEEEKQKTSGMELFRKITFWL